jgi:hypothetical protein
MSYPSEITIAPGTEEYDFFMEHSDLFKSLASEYGTVKFSQDIFFGGDENKWKLFLDLFFPEQSIQPIFVNYNFNTHVIPEVLVNRGVISRQQTFEDIMDIFEYLMMDRVTYKKPKRNSRQNPILNKYGQPIMTNATNIIGTQQKMAQTLFELAQRRRNIHYSNNNNTEERIQEPREEPRRYTISSRVFNENNNYYQNNNNENYNNVEVGLTEEEEKTMGSVDPKYHKYFKKGGRKTRKVRKGRKGKYSKGTKRR